MIHAITFDLWNTLFENISYSGIRLDYLIKFFEERGINFNNKKLNNVYNSNFDFVDTEYKKGKARHIYTHERVSHILNELNVEISSGDKESLVKKFEISMYQAPPPLKKGAYDTLYKLRAQYKIGIISDTGITPGYAIRKVLDDYGILGCFDTTIFSDETGFYKPHPIAFTTALKNLNCLPENSIHIGDLLETDIIGAKNCKMRTVWFRDTNQKKSLKIQPDFEIKELPQVIDIIESIN